MSNGKPGRAPETAKRERFIELIAAGATIADASRQVDVNYRTARRWIKGRTVRDPTGHTRHYDPVITVKPVVSGRYLSQEERIVVNGTSVCTAALTSAHQAAAAVLAAATLTAAPAIAASVNSGPRGRAGHNRKDVPRCPWTADHWRGRSPGRTHSGRPAAHSPPWERPHRRPPRL